MAVRFSETELIDLAKQVKRLGESFYDEALRATEDDQVRSIFRFLRDEERRHADTYERFLEDEPDRFAAWRSDPEYQEYLAALAAHRVFEGADAARVVAKYVTEEKDALRLGLDLERDTLSFFEELRSLAFETCGPILEKLIVEERRHVTSISRLLRGMGGTLAYEN